MRIFAFLRTDMDWNFFNSKKCLYPKDHFSKIFPLWKIPYFWDKCVSLSYAEYRKKCKIIGRNQMFLPTVVKYKDFANLDNDDIVLPIDEDDWHHPDLFDILKKKFNGQNYEFGCWECLLYHSVGTSKMITFSEYNKKGQICSNGYFFSIGALKKMKAPSEQLYPLLSHLYVKDYAKKYNLKSIDLQNHILAQYNKHPGSITSINASCDLEHFKRFFKKQESPIIPKEHAWAEPATMEFYELIQNLKVDSKYKEPKIF